VCAWRAASGRVLRRMKKSNGGCGCCGADHGRAAVLELRLIWQQQVLACCKKRQGLNGAEIGDLRGHVVHVHLFLTSCGDYVRI
jgi:hypothetical protein